MGYAAYNNDNPTQNVFSDLDVNMFEIRSKTNTEMVLGDKVPHNAGVYSYIGCIANPTTQEIIWVNNSRPLP